jgi:hypothetical protein
VVAEVAVHRERSDTVLAHIAERHRADRFVSSGHGLPTLRNSSAPHCDQLSHIGLKLDRCGFDRSIGVNRLDGADPFGLGGSTVDFPRQRRWLRLAGEGAGLRLKRSRRRWSSQTLVALGTLNQKCEMSIGPG